MQVGDKVQFRYNGNKKYDNKFGTVLEIMNDSIVLLDVGGVKTTAFVEQLEVKTKEDLNEWRRKKINGDFRRAGFPVRKSKQDE